MQKRHVTASGMGSTVAAPRLRRLDQPVHGTGIRAALYSLKPYLYLLPGFALLIFWLYRPLSQTFYYAFVSWGMIPGTEPTWVGLDNFTRLLNNKDLGTAVINTVFYTVGLLPFAIVIPLLLSVMTNSMNKRAKNIYRAFMFIPMIMAPVSSATIWRWLLHPSNGLINKFLQAIGLTSSNIAFFSTEGVATWAILGITGWKMIGFGTLMFSAALTGVNPTYYEAAALDGASPRRRFFDLTLPLISPTIVFMLTMSILFASQWTFSYIDILTSGGPSGTSTNISYEIYTYGVANCDGGMSSAAALLFMLVFGAISIGLTRLSNRITFYDKNG
ncbi:MAG: sugar ABC transporter permease [Oscillospiraceae bacterium]|nr:sugar ABC transporter permease [Oscillospiraceae bacterium]